MAANKILPVRLPIDWKISHPIIQDLLSKLKSAVNSNIDDISTLNTTVSGLSGGNWTLVKKTADETRTSTTTLANDSTLVFTVAASKKYAFRFRVFYNTAVTPDIRFILAGPTLGSGTLCYAPRYIAPNTATYTVGVNVLSAFSNPPTTGIQATATGGTYGYIEIDGSLQTDSGGAGTVAFQWAQDTSSGNATTVLAGSYLEWVLIA